MNLTYFEAGFFPFCVPAKDASFASSVRAQAYQLTASGTGAYGGVSQSLAISGPLPARNAAVGTSSYATLTGFSPTGPADLVCGRGVRQVAPGAGTITASGTGGTGSGPALFNLQVNLFYPEIFAPDPVVRYDGLWWPALSISCAVTNTVALTGGGSESLSFDCTTLPDGVCTTSLGTFTFFGAAVPVFCRPLAPPSGPDPGETRTFSGALSVSAEWP